MLVSLILLQDPPCSYLIIPELNKKDIIIDKHLGGVIIDNYYNEYSIDQSDWRRLHRELKNSDLPNDIRESELLNAFRNIGADIDHLLDVVVVRIAEDIRTRWK